MTNLDRLRKLPAVRIAKEIFAGKYNCSSCPMNSSCENYTNNACENLDERRLNECVRSWLVWLQSKPEKEEIFPCKCGEEAKLYHTPAGFYYVGCTKCYAQARPYETAEKAIEAWNTGY